MNRDDLIQKYIHGKLNVSEQAEFDALLQSDPDFADEVTAYENLHKAISVHEKNKLKTQLQQLETSDHAEHTGKSSTRFYKRLAIAVVLLLFFGLIGSYFIQLGNANEGFYAAYFEPYPNALAPVTRTTDNQNDLEAALFAYESEAYEEAITKFDAVLQQNTSQQTEILFYKAMSYVNLGNEQEAIGILRTIKHEKTKFTPQIYWYGALIHLKLDEKEKAIKALEYMDAQQMSFKSKERIALKNSLE